jgi:hypothetical protein
LQLCPGEGHLLSIRKFHRRVEESAFKGYLD